MEDETEKLLKKRVLTDVEEKATMVDPELTNLNEAGGKKLFGWENPYAETDQHGSYEINARNGTPMEVEPLGKAKITNAKKRVNEILPGDKRNETENLDPNFSREYLRERGLDLFTQEWAKNGRPKNQYLIGNVDQWTKKSGAHPAHLTSDEMEAPSKNNLIPQLETELNDVKEISRSVGEKPPRARRWKKLARENKRGTGLLVSVAGSKRSAENESTDGDQAKNMRQKPTRYDVSASTLEDFQTAVAEP
ncbi:hypothetical protein U1Q18_000425 [Sarracenia purpurea var. burkii]